MQHLPGSPSLGLRAAFCQQDESVAALAVRAQPRLPVLPPRCARPSAAARAGCSAGRAPVSSLSVPGVALSTSSDSLSSCTCGVFCLFYRLCSSDIKYTARWSNETVFSSILISPKMVTDHMPDVVLKALNSLSQEPGSCISCQTREECNTNLVQP